MKKLLILVIVFLVSTFIAMAQDPQLEAFESGVATLQDVDGNVVGEVVLTARADGKIAVSVIVTELPAGFHGFHVHQIGECDPDTDPPFDSAGGHLNLEGNHHHDHSGDLPVLLINSDGTGELITVTDRFTLADLMDDDGSAFIIHENANNYANIPERYGGPDEETLDTGDSGARIVCGVVEENTAVG